MSNNIPKVQLILGYKEILGEEPPEHRLSLIEGICKKNLIAEIAGLNYRLKSKTDLQVDTRWETQADELTYFCGVIKNL
jgi:hypothetical protein